MTRLKKSVSVYGLKPEILFAAIVARDVFAAYGYEFVITSGSDGKHGRGSLHYQGLAIDIRTRHVEENMHQALKTEIADRLTDEFDVVLEETHIHIEYQRKS